MVKQTEQKKPPRTPDIEIFPKGKEPMVRDPMLPAQPPQAPPVDLPYKDIPKDINKPTASDIPRPSGLAGNYASNNLIPNTSNDLLNAELRAIYSGDKLKLAQLERDANARLQAFQQQATSANLTAEGKAQQVTPENPLSNNMANDLLPPLSTSALDVGEAISGGITGAASGAGVGAIAGAPFAGIGAAPGAIGGAVIGGLFGVAYAGSSDAKQKAMEAKKVGNMAISDMDTIINQLNSDPTYSRFQARQDFDRAVSMLRASERNLKKLTETEIDSKLSKARDEYSVVLRELERLPQTTNEFNLALVAPNPSLVRKTIAFQDLQP